METPNLEEQNVPTNVSENIEADNAENANGNENWSGQTDTGKNRKKYHSSAMYAASKWHNTVSHVKPTHTGLNL
jgi:hypothetical protein